MAAGVSSMVCIIKTALGAAFGVNLQIWDCVAGTKKASQCDSLFYT